MGIRFRKSFGFGPLRMTLSKNGVSVSTGIPGLRLTQRADGKVQSTIGIPGSGLSVVNVHSSRTATGPAAQRTPGPRGAIVLLAIFITTILSYAFGWIGFIVGLSLFAVYIYRKADAASRALSLAASSEGFQPPRPVAPAVAPAPMVQTSVHDSDDDLGDLDFQTEARAATEHRRVWIKYEDNSMNESERKIEIYAAKDDQYIHAWCCLRRGPRTFRRDRILEWRLLDERFEFNPVLEKWWQEEYPQGDEKIPWARFLSLSGPPSNNPAH